MDYKLVIFDMGNTLLDFHGGEHTDEEKDIIGCHNMSAYLKLNHNIDVSPSHVKADLIDKWYSDFYLRKKLIELDVCIYVKAFMKSINHDDVKVDCKALMTQFYKPYMEEVLVNDGALEALKTLGSKINIGVISNCILFDELYMKTFDEQGLSQYIDKFIFSYSRQIRKPDKRLFQEMLDHFNIKASEAIMIGDSYAADIEPAKEIGIKTIWFSNEKRDGHSADLVIDSLEKCVSAVNQLEK